ncbi:MAG: twin transmembrane helix small protein [Pseudomonadota bacterium]
MQTALTYGFYIALAATFVVLVLGIVNIVRQDDRQASRSNQLMRMRVLFQFIAVLFLIGIGFAAGALNWG